MLVWGGAVVDVGGVGVVVVEVVVWKSRVLELECLGVRMRRHRHGWVVYERYKAGG